MMKKNKNIIPLYSLSYNPVIEYFQWIQENRDKVNVKIFRTYSELVNIINSSESPWEYSYQKANHALEFIEKYCKHSKGKLGGKPFILELWQKAIIAATFGYVHKIDGTRKHQEVLLVVARKNGKSTLAAAVGLYLMIADSEPGAEIYAVATKKDQAKIIWLEAKRMVKKSPVLSRRIKALVAEMVSEFNDSFFKPIGSDSDTLDGLNVHGALLDEIHAWKDKNLYDVIVDGVTAREQPLIFITTTAGTIRECIYDIKYDEAERVINGYGNESGYKNERMLPIIYELDSRKEWTLDKSWIKANPGLGTIKSLDQLSAKVVKAQANPLLVKNLLCKDFNIRETVSEAWLTFEQLNNEALFSLDELRPRYGIAGADLSTTTDLTNATVIFKVPGDDNTYVLQMYWLPEELLDKRVQEDKIPYDIWRDLGLLRTHPGNKIHHACVTQWFEEVQSEYDIYLFKGGYDSWSATYWVEEMKSKFGDIMVPVIQGKKTLSGPMKSLGAELESNSIVYNNNPILKWCLSNVAIEMDKNLNIQPCKTNNQRRRIDGFAGLLNAWVVYETFQEDYLNII